MMRPQNETAPFVDLYDLLDMSPNSDVAAIRKRITSLYIEAQNNLEHRNFRKRFYYQELFETYLPQAHHLLLNEARRATYDGQLQAHHQHAIGDSDELRLDKPSPATQLEVAQAASKPGALPLTNDVNSQDPAQWIQPAHQRHAPLHRLAAHGCRTCGAPPRLQAARPDPTRTPKRRLILGRDGRLGRGAVAESVALFNHQ
jgi:hypothetical protein